MLGYGETCSKLWCRVATQHSRQPRPPHHPNRRPHPPHPHPQTNFSLFRKIEDPIYKE